ncbi:hypothetical protein BJV82DRAFT_658997 [Fennellomyces sp. T-0311]|nr:hypothetical protein BJV82DRAFT_658997 [Fennellomyces sp. T-0311]
MPLQLFLILSLSAWQFFGVMNVSATKQRDPLENKSDNEGKATKRRAEDSKQTMSNASTAESHSEGHADSGTDITVKGLENIQDAQKLLILTILGVEESTTDAQAKIESDWTAARHPLLKDPSHKYFVNNTGEFRSFASGKMKTLTPIRYHRTTAYHLFVTTKQKKAIKLNEIMMWTFRGGLDESRDRIFHKDGDLKNCALDNLEVYSDLPTLYRLEIALREKLCPGTKYTPAKVLDGEKTYSQYLVSDAGAVFSLRNRRHLCGTMKTYVYFNLSPDFDRKREVGLAKSILAHELVMASFRGPPPPSTPYIKHINGDLHDNRLVNLQYDSVEEVKLKKRHKCKPSPGASYPNSDKEVPPLPEVTDETRWRTIGSLPWRESAYSGYEVSDMGHVRKIGSTQCLDVRRNYQGHLCVALYRDRYASDESIELRPLVYPKAPVCYLVAYRFVQGYSEENNIVMHKDGDMENNSWENLKWINTELRPRRSMGRVVTVRLVDGPSVEKRFDYLKEAEKELAIYLRSKRIASGKSIEREVTWDACQYEMLMAPLKLNEH